MAAPTRAHASAPSLPPAPQATEIEVGPAEASEKPAFHPLETWQAPSTLLDSLKARFDPGRTGRVPLFIVDTGWPSASDRARSMAAVDTLLTWARVRYALNRSASPLASTVLRPLKETPPCSLDSASPSSGSKMPADSMDFRDPSHRHVCGIARAISPLVAVDPRGRFVQVSYVPLSIDQPGSKEMIEALLWTFYGLRVRQRHENAGAGRGGRPWPRLTTDERDEIEQRTQLAMREMPRGALPDGRVTTHPELFTALHMLLTLRAEARRIPFVLSLSWTVRQNALVDVSAEPGGVAVVAAGNDAMDVTLRKPKLDFAPRSLLRGGSYLRYLTVLVVDDGGTPACSSGHFNQVDKEELRMAFAVGFNGALDPQHCRTSWATPRVAWLLAARWATQKRSVTGSGNVGDYLSDAQQVVIKRRERARAPTNLVVDPQTLVFHDPALGGKP